MKTDTGKIISRKFISGPLFQTERKTRREPTPRTSGEIQPKNRYCLRGLDGKYGRWDEILRDILNGKLKYKIGKTDSETEDEDDDDDDEEMPEVTEHMTHPNETEVMSRSKQIRMRMQFKSMPKMIFLVRI